MSDHIPHDDARRAQNLDRFGPIKDEDGKAKYFFHNTNRNFSEFNTLQSELGAHFGTPNQAAHLKANQDNPLAGRRTMAVHLNIKNPLRLIDKGDFQPETVAEQLYEMGLLNEKKYDKHMDGDFMSDEEAYEDLQNAIRKAGHDGVVYLNRREGIAQDPDPETEKKKQFWHFAMAHRATDDDFKEKFPDAQDSYIAFHPTQIKSATGNQGTFDPRNPDITKAEGGAVDLSQYQEQTPFGLYSHAAETAAALPQAKGTPDQMKSMLLKQGVKPAEIEHSQYDDIFAGRPSVTKDELVQHFRQSMPNIKEHVLREQGNDQRTKFQQYSMPGGENYRETLLQYQRPESIYERMAGEVYRQKTDLIDRMQGMNTLDPGYAEMGKQVMDLYNKYHDLLDKASNQDQGGFRAGHWDQDDVLAHLRMKDRSGPNGEKILHIDEIQSDWAQSGRRRGFKDLNARKNYADFLDGMRQKLSDRNKQVLVDNNVPPEKHGEILDTVAKDINKLSPAALANLLDMNEEHQQALDRLAKLDNGIPTAPYVTNTAAWTDLALKRALHEAANGGYDKMVITKGEDQAERYDLSNHIDSIEAEALKNGKVRIKALSKDDEDVVHESEHHPDDLPDVVGKEVADRIMRQIKFPERIQGYVIENKQSGFRTAPTASLERAQEVLGQYPESIRSSLQITPVDHVRGGRDAYLSGLDLKIGGEGMKSFYDKIVPKQLNDILKRHDPEVKVGRDTIDTPDGKKEVHAIQMTPKLRQSILGGQKAFAEGGTVPDEGITAYHGSPYDFDRFDISKIGTGEGAQAFGHGLYFAQAEPTAREYRDKLSQGTYKTDAGEIFDPSDLEHKTLRVHARKGIDEGLAHANELIKDPVQNKELLARDIEKLTQAKAQSAQPYQGHMYEVHINAHPDHFLDWDKPLRDQKHFLAPVLDRFGGEKNVRDSYASWEKLNEDLMQAGDYDPNHPLWKEYDKRSAFGPERAMLRLGNLLMKLDKEEADPEKYAPERQLTLKGEDLWRAVSQVAAKNHVGAELLKEIGLPGIKYLDAGSRFSGADQATHNYVVFDDKLVNVKRKYADGGVVNG
jgi:hypothetical protein